MACTILRDFAKRSLRLVHHLWCHRSFWTGMHTHASMLLMNIVNTVPNWYGSEHMEVTRFFFNLGTGRHLRQEGVCIPGYIHNIEIQQGGKKAKRAGQTFSFGQ